MIEYAYISGDKLKPKSDSKSPSEVKSRVPLMICDNCQNPIFYVNDVKTIFNDTVMLCPKCYLARLDYMLWADSSVFQPDPEPEYEWMDWNDLFDDDDDFDD